ncbi:hypothetical protein CVT26_005489 [Gymnopilus dilepis]|uniref:Uncharacterized protein n=1 Tax=Gymnopilus dilepis TaxID=231916 RepID=A0A409WJM8_9AGAR|nr:hypothetical protein CVT26_005489 [Gymnopilus dilepis]
MSIMQYVVEEELSETSRLCVRLLRDRASAFMTTTGSNRKGKQPELWHLERRRSMHNPTYEV